MPKPEITYDEDANALYVRLRTAKVELTEIHGRVAIDLGADGDVVGVEIVYSSE